MPHPAIAVLESALRSRKLDRTLTSRGDACVAPTHVAPTALAGLDAALHGGVPRGQLSEIAGPHSSGRTTLLLQVLAAATCRGEIAALVDTFDRLDLASVVSAGVDLDRLLWIRGQAITHQLSTRQATEAQRHGEHFQSDPVSPCLSVSVARNQSGLLERTIERALKALNLVLQAGGFGVVAFDLADAPLAALNRIPFTTWLRVQRTIEGSDTACVLVAPQPLARSSGGLTLSLAGRTEWAGHVDRSRRLAGMDVTVRILSPRRRVDGEVEVSALANDSR
jgi:recombination protein RecA